MTVDAHVHVWDLAVREQPWTEGLAPLRRSFSLEDLAPELAAGDVDQVVLVQTVCVAEETPELLALAAIDRRVLAVVGWVDLCAADVRARLTELRELPGGEALAAVRHQVQGEAERDWLCRADVRAGLVALADAGLAYELVVRSDQLGAVLDTVRALPGLRFVLDHGGNPDLSSSPDPAWAEAIAALGAAPNVSAKLSGLTSDVASAPPYERLAPFARTLLEAFGPGRLMFGSDWPVCTLGGGYSTTLATLSELVDRLAPDRRADVFDHTARAVFGRAR